MSGNTCRRQTSCWSVCMHSWPNQVEGTRALLEITAQWAQCTQKAVTSPQYTDQIACEAVAAQGRAL
eukprot:1158372-Pelagomonas_calceolata.AAC.10